MWLAVAIDATDGTLARKIQVKDIIPKLNGDRLEDIVDYLNYVLVPCAFILRAELLSPNVFWIIVLPLLASAYGFCQYEAKTADQFFLGFPSFWNVIAFYFYVLETPIWLNAVSLSAFSVLVFVPIKYVYPSRTLILRVLTVSLGILWGCMVLLIIFLLPEAPTKLVYGSFFFPVYYASLSYWLEIRRRKVAG